jgi:hypothetical protein
MNLTRPTEDELVLSFTVRKKLKHDALKHTIEQTFSDLAAEADEMLAHYEALGLKVGKTLQILGDNTRTKPARVPAEVPDKEGGEA